MCTQAGSRSIVARNARFNRALSSLSKEQAIRFYDDVLFKTTADEAALVIISGIKRNKSRILIGTDVKVINLITRFFPVNAVAIMNAFFRFMARTYASKGLKEKKHEGPPNDHSLGHVRPSRDLMAMTTPKSQFICQFFQQGQRCPVFGTEQAFISKILDTNRVGCYQLSGKKYDG